MSVSGLRTEPEVQRGLADEKVVGEVSGHQLCRLVGERVGVRVVGPGDTTGPKTLVGDQRLLSTTPDCRYRTRFLTVTDVLSVDRTL